MNRLASNVINIRYLKNYNINQIIIKKKVKIGKI